MLCCCWRVRSSNVEKFLVPEWRADALLPDLSNGKRKDKLILRALHGHALAPVAPNECHILLCGVNPLQYNTSPRWIRKHWQQQHGA